MTSKITEAFAFDFNTGDDFDEIEADEAISNMWDSYGVGAYLKYDKNSGKFSMNVGTAIAMCVCDAEKSPTGNSLWMAVKDVCENTNNFPTIQFGGCGEPAPFKTQCKHEPLAYYLPDKSDLEAVDPMPSDCNGVANTEQLSKFDYYTAAKLAKHYNPEDSNTAGKWYIPSIGELHAINYKQMPDDFFTSAGVMWSSSVYDDKMVYVHSNTQSRLCEYGMDGYAYLRPFLNLS